MEVWKSSKNEQDFFPGLEHCRKATNLDHIEPQANKRNLHETAIYFVPHV
jgi:hypothetical protein